MAIPVQTRQKMLDAIDRGESVASVARRFEVSQYGLRRLRKAVQERGTLQPAKTGPKRHLKLTDADLQLMRDQVEANPGITLRELQAQLSVQVAESTVCRALKKMGMSFKKSR